MPTRCSLRPDAATSPLSLSFLIIKVQGKTGIQKFSKLELASVNSEGFLPFIGLPGRHCPPTGVLIRPALTSLPLRAGCPLLLGPHKHTGKVAGEQSSLAAIGPWGSWLLGIRTGRLSGPDFGVSHCHLQGSCLSRDFDLRGSVSHQRGWGPEG